MAENKIEWRGVSISNQQQADKRIPELLKVPARVRFLSVEPLLGPVDLTRIRVPVYKGVRFSALQRSGADSWGTGACIDWVIVGGESGPGARPCNVEWVRSIVRQCRDAGVPVFVKQLGAVSYCKAENTGNPVGPMFPLNLRDKKGGDINEWPEDLRVREFPLVEAHRGESEA